MTAEVVSLRRDIPPGGVNQDLVDALRELLEWAEAGEITSGGFAYVGKQGHRLRTGFEVAQGEIHAALAASALLQYRLAQAVDERSRDLQ
ncbi:MAG TPA: hypothetical protein VD768_06110 [Sphingomicrobium sp.]|nr:hypothetical protein [Sphingomicrobium sp.]